MSTIKTRTNSTPRNIFICKTARQVRVTFDALINKHTTKANRISFMRRKTCKYFNSKKIIKRQSFGFSCRVSENFKVLRNFCISSIPPKPKTSSVLDFPPSLSRQEPAREIHLHSKLTSLECRKWKFPLRQSSRRNNNFNMLTATIRELSERVNVTQVHSRV